MNVIEDNPDALIDVEGIGRIRVERIKKSWQEQKEIKNIMLFLQSYEVSTSHATKIFKTYGGDSIRIVKDNRTDWQMTSGELDLDSGSDRWEAGI